MAKVFTVRVGDKDLKAIEQQFEIKREDWNEYTLLDGGKVRVKTTVGRIFRVLDESGKPAVTPQGDPNVIVRHQTQVVAVE